MTITEKIKNFDDVLNYHNISTEDFEKKVKDLSNDEKAYVQLKHIVSALNEGWTPDWENYDEWKHYPWFDMDDSSSSGRFSFFCSDDQSALSIVGSRLCYKSRDLCRYAVETFLEIYKEFFTIKN